MSNAERLARHLHVAQRDKAGRPYVEHLAAVVAILRRRWPDSAPHEIEAAWLHDALEDTPITPGGLVAEGVSPAAVAIIRELTRSRLTTYRDWIADLAATGSLSAVKIKLADNEHNSDPARRLEGSDIIEKRYRPAKMVLEEALVRRMPLAEDLLGMARR